MPELGELRQAMKLTMRMKRPWTQIDDGGGQDARASANAHT